MERLHKHLEHPNTKARLQFADFSSASNTLQSHILAEKLSTHFHLDNQLILWISDFLTNRSQKMLVNNTSSDVLVTSTGSPQGCVLSPLLIILYTDDCRSTHPDCHLVKYADSPVLALQSLTSPQLSVVVWLIGPGGKHGEDQRDGGDLFQQPEGAGCSCHQHNPLEEYRACGGVQVLRKSSRGSISWGCSTLIHL